MHEHTVDSYVKDAKIVGAIMVGDFTDLGVGEPAPD